MSQNVTGTIKVTVPIARNSAKEMNAAYELVKQKLTEAFKDTAVTFDIESYWDYKATDEEADVVVKEMSTERKIN